MKIRVLKLRFALFYGVLLLSLSACQSQTVTPQWRWQRAETGLPRQAIVTSVAVDPADPRQLWAGIYGPASLVTSHDGGHTWQTGAAGLDDNPVFDLLVTSEATSSSGSSVWAATRDGLLQSRDAGASWLPASGDVPRVTAFALATDAGGRLYVGFDGAGIYAASQDRAGWLSLRPQSARLAGGDSLAVAEIVAPAAVISLAVSPDGQQLYAGTPGQGIFASCDAGQTWQITYMGEYVPNIVLNPLRPTVAIASLRNRLVRTRDGGQSWHTLPLAWTKDEIVSLLWLADGTLGAGTGQGRLFRSLDHGDTWLEGGDGLPPGGGVLDLAAVEGSSPGEPPQLLAGTWTGIFGSYNGGVSWSQLALDLGQPHAQTLLATDTGLMLGARTGLYLWQPASRHWTPLPANLPSGVASLAAHPQDNRLLYAGTQGHGVFQSTDAGDRWSPLPTLTAGIPAVAVDPKNSEHIYILAAWERVYESFDGGQNWNARWDGLGKIIEATALAVDPLEPIAYVGTEAGLFRSDDGQEWTLTAPTLADQSILALYSRPGPAETAAETVLYIGTTRGVYRSLDHGETVQGYHQGSDEWGRGLENRSVTVILTEPSNADLLYAGTAYAGVYQSIDRGQTWQPIGMTDLASGVVAAMAWGPGQELFVVTTAGVWRGERLN
ncbi:MAG: hypothetical protein OES12_00360 [Anaerolineae bacterium]|nr:hypothetical protein [Anaerolineae bacterium]